MEAVPTDRTEVRRTPGLALSDSRGRLCCMAKRIRRHSTSASITTDTGIAEGTLIKLEREQFSVGDLLNWHLQGGLDLTPRFQRRPVWKAGAKSFLIDTVLRGLPMPAVILRDRGSDLKSLKPLREVVDGQQRLRSLFSFVKPDALAIRAGQTESFVIQRAHQPEYPNAKYTDLPETLQRRILDYRIITHIFPLGTEDPAILEVFARLNATGTALKPQELRNARFYGEFKTLCFSLGTRHLAFWIESGVFKDDSIARMEEVELTSDLVLLLMRGIGEGSKSILDRAYKDFDESLPQISAIETRFGETIAALGRDFDFSSAKRFRNKSLFYCLFAAYYDVLYGLGSNLTARKRPATADAEISQVIERCHRVSTLDAPQRVLAATERRLSHKAERTLVVNYLRHGHSDA